MCSNNQLYNIEKSLIVLISLIRELFSTYMTIINFKAHLSYRIKYYLKKIQNKYNEYLKLVHLIDEIAQGYLLRRLK